MVSRVLTGLAFLLLASVGSAEQKKIVGYAPNWLNADDLSKEIQFGKLTHLNIAFENPVDDDGNLSFDKADSTFIAKAHANGVKVLISIGGGSASTDAVLQKRYFSLTAADKRDAFVAKLTKYVLDHKFDGLDVDIEGPSIGDDYGPFVSALAKSLHAKHKLVTAALSEGYGGDKVPPSVFEDLDFANVMAYDGTGPWDKNRPGQHSSMDLAKDAVKYWVGRGLSKSKTVLGVPFYGYGFGDSYRGDEYSFRELVAQYPGSEKFDQVGKTIWYNGIPTIQAKAQYVLDEGLAGVMIWSLNSDAVGELSLLSALHRTLTKGKSR